MVQIFSVGIHKKGKKKIKKGVNLHSVMANDHSWDSVFLATQEYPYERLAFNRILVQCQCLCPILGPIVHFHSKCLPYHGENDCNLNIFH